MFVYFDPLINTNLARVKERAEVRIQTYLEEHAEELEQEKQARIDASPGGLG